MKKEQKNTPDPENFTEYLPGDVINGNIVHSIFHSGPNYIIYTPKNDTMAIGSSYRRYESDIMNPISALLTEVNGMRKKLNDPSRYNSNIAASYVQCLNKNPENAVQILVNVKQEIKKDFTHEAKIGYLKITLLLIALNTLITLILYYTKAYVENDLVREYFTIATFGSFGGFLSTVYKINKLDFEKEENKKLLFFLSVSRVVLAMLSSIIIYIFIKSNIILGILNKAENVYVYYIFAVVAGFSETFIPDILKKIEKKTNEKEN